MPRNLTIKQRNAAINYMIENAERVGHPDTNPADLIYDILSRIMPKKIVYEAWEYMEKQETKENG